MYKAILHATDLATNHLALCQKAQAIAKCFDASLYLIHIVTTPSSLQLAQSLGFTAIEPPTTLIEDAISVIQVIGNSLRIPKKHLFVAAGSVKECVFHQAQELENPLIIIGQHVQEYFYTGLDNTTQSIVDEAPYDVLTIN